ISRHPDRFTVRVPHGNAVPNTRATEWVTAYRAPPPATHPAANPTQRIIRSALADEPGADRHRAGLRQRPAVEVAAPHVGNPHSRPAQRGAGGNRDLPAG